jgi:hypothetical protein
MKWVRWTKNHNSQKKQHTITSFLTISVVSSCLLYYYVSNNGWMEFWDLANIPTKTRHYRTPTNSQLLRALPYLAQRA